MKLSLVPGNRRALKRELKEEASFFISFRALSDIKFPISWVARQFGTIQLSIDKALFDLLDEVSPLTEIEITKGHDVVVNGSWQIAEKTSRAEKYFLLLEHRFAKELGGFAQHVLPENIFLTNGYRLISAPTEDSTDEVFGRHLAELKDCPIPVICQVAFQPEASYFHGTFDFSSGAKVLSNLDFRVEEIPEGLLAKSKITVNYEFLGARFIFLSSIETIDHDFNIVSVGIPETVLCLTNRQYDRMSESVKVKILLSPEAPLSVDCTLMNISVSGAEAHFDKALDHSHTLAKDSEVLITLADKTNLPAIVTNIRKTIIGLKFPEHPDTTQGRRSLFLEAASRNLAIRTFGNYDSFLELYQESGYGAESSGAQTWAEQSKAIWNKQDTTLPGNTVGYIENNQLLLCSSILPMSANTAVVHSVGIRKQVQTLPKMLEIMNYCQSWLSLFPEIKTLFICFREKSRFMTRLHISAENQPTPERTKILNCFGYTGVPAKSDQEVFDLKLDDDAFRLNLSGELLAFARTLSSTHSEMTENHQISQLALTKKGSSEFTAFIFHHTAPHLLTALDTFRTVFCLIPNPVHNITEIVDYLGTQSRFRDHEICVFIEGFKDHKDFKYEGVMSATPLICYLLDKADFAPLIGSLHRFIYTTLRKYGEDSFEYLSKVVTSR